MIIFRSNVESLFIESFPIELKEKYKRVFSKICPFAFTKERYERYIAHGYNSDNEWYLLSDSEMIRFPYRVYLKDNDSVYLKLPDNESKLIYDCIFTRNCDGYVREKYLRNILDSDFPEWCIPYILRLSSEYVVEIVETIYETLKTRDNTDIQAFCRNNPKMVNRAYTRMVSYWDCFYKDKCWRFKDYVGRKLFRECFLPGVNFEKL